MPYHLIRLRLMLSLGLMIASLQVLSACADSTKISANDDFCPAAIVPDDATLNWTAQTKTPAGFDSWLSKISKQQAFFAGGCK